MFINNDILTRSITSSLGGGSKLWFSVLASKLDRRGAVLRRGVPHGHEAPHRHHTAHPQLVRVQPIPRQRLEAIARHLELQGATRLAREVREYRSEHFTNEDGGGR